MFCANCGKRISNGAKFCENCGAPAPSGGEKQTRESVYEGKIHKCPHCGETLSSFTAVCPVCKREIRGGGVADSVNALLSALSRAHSQEEKIQIIKTFPVPNSREDILEFMVLASSNFDAEYYATHLNEEDISDAWLAKIEQCYQKAKLSGNRSFLNEIEALYNEIKEKIQKAKSTGEKKIKKQKAFPYLRTFGIVGIVFGSLFLLFIIIGACLRLFNFNPDAIKIGYSYEDFVGQQYYEVSNLLEEKGFTNITLIEQSREWLDLVTKKSGEVASVSIDGVSEFATFSKFNPDDLVVIHYYK